jgi:hypothetical protein
MSSSLTEDLQVVLNGLRKLRRDLDAETAMHVGKAAHREEAKRLAQAWRQDLVVRLRAQAWADRAMLTSYDEQFKKLLELSISPNRRKTYETSIQAICRAFRKDLILPSVAGGEASGPDTWDSFLSELPTSTEGDYFREAVDCAKSGYLRASAVIGWCACVDHIHRKIAAVGFDTFSRTSEKLAAQTTGRFKRFNKRFVIESIGDLRATVFDDDLLLVVEGLGLIDNNEFRRLRSCFDLRNQAGHPGDAPVTEFNLMSFFSDIVSIVLKNDKFQATQTVA